MAIQKKPKVEKKLTTNPNARMKSFVIQALGREMTFTKNEEPKAQMHRSRAVFDSFVDGLTLRLHVLKYVRAYFDREKKHHDTWWLEIYHGDAKLNFNSHEKDTALVAVEDGHKEALRIAGIKIANGMLERESALKKLVDNEKNLAFSQLMSKRLGDMKITKTTKRIK